MAGDQLGAASAKRLTEQINKAVENLWDLVVAAYGGRAWKALGYNTWDAYVEGEFGSLKIRIPKEDRREICAHLRDHGLSLRAISSATGYDRRTVVNDLVEKAPQLVPTRARSPHPTRSPIHRAVADMTKSGQRLAKLCTATTPLEVQGVRSDVERLRTVLDEVIGLLEKRPELRECG